MPPFPTLLEAIDEYIDSWGWDDDEALQFLNLVEDVMETEYTSESSQLSVQDVDFFPPGYNIATHYTSVPGMGLGNIASKYAEPLVDKIRLNARVTEIDSQGWMDQVSDTIVKFVEDGESKEVSAKTVLVTASLGVLKEGTIDFV